MQGLYVSGLDCLITWIVHLHFIQDMTCVYIDLVSLDPNLTLSGTIYNHISWLIELTCSYKKRNLASTVGNQEHYCRAIPA